MKKVEYQFITANNGLSNYCKLKILQCKNYKEYLQVENADIKKCKKTLSPMRDDMELWMLANKENAVMDFKQIGIKLTISFTF